MSNTTNGTNKTTRSSRTESEEAVASRRDFFAKFARRNAVRVEKNGLDKVNEETTQDSRHHKSWLIGVKKDAWDAKQLEYTKQYSVEYEVNNHDYDHHAGPSTSHENMSSATSTISDNDTVVSLRTARGRFLRNRMVAMSSKSSVADFERTSTVQPPSVMINSEEYTSSIDVADIKRTYFQRYKTNQDLPIYKHRNYLINSINTYSVVMISGATGCGKTTQVPAYILEDAILSGKQTKAPVIYVTQPRKIAARSIARRVCDEHNWTLGSLVGYQVGLDKVAGSDTILTFCTAGVLLQKLIHEKSLKGFTHIIVDEAHERDSDTDLLLMFIRLLMRREMSYIRLIVMSATMDMTKLKDYFSFNTNYGHRAITTPSIVMVEGRETNDITIIYLDKVKSHFGVEVEIPDFDCEQPELFDECVKAAYKIIIDVIPHMDTYSGATESTLVFLPGMAEIGKLHHMLREAEDHLDIIPLHSCLSPLDHDRVFRDSEPGRRKVILATNIAESSITVKDVGFIIDFCLTKRVMKDSITNFPALTLQWSTVDKSTQRAGRTGRCCPGKVFRLVTQNFFKCFDTYARPELLCAPLELAVLRVKEFQMGEVKALLAVVLDPPPISEIRTAVLELKQIGALSSTYEGEISDMDGDMTELGKVIAALPIDVHLSKLIVLASVLDVLEDAIIVAACLSTNRTVVQHLYGNRPETYRLKLDWAKGSFSDLFISLDVYKDYMEQRYKKKDSTYLLNYCNNKHLDEKKLYEVTSLIEELKYRLAAKNIMVVEQPNRERNIYEDELMLKIAFCASFYPNYFLTNEMDIDDIDRSLCGLDPTKTLIVHNIPVNQVPLYRTQIIDQVIGKAKGDSSFDHKIELDNEIEFIADNSRALLVFSDKKKMLTDSSSQKAIGVKNIIQPSRDVDQAIYLAIKLGECDRYQVREYHEHVAFDRMQYYDEKRREVNTRNRLAPSWTKIVAGMPADNTRLETEDSEEYSKINYIEVEENFNQWKHDLIELRNLKRSERPTLQNMHLHMSELTEHPIYKRIPKAVRGPTSPVQMTFRSVLEKSRGYKADVDFLSVNSILLNPDYTIPRRQMLVAAAVDHSKKNRIRMCDTTLMPNIRGLPTLMAMLFAQYYRLVYDQSMNCIAGAIFGLGWDENDMPIDKSYEVELGFDVQITKDDIDLVNNARKRISDLLQNIEVKEPGAPRAHIQEQLRMIILSLIKKRRFPVEEINLASVNWSTNERYLKDKHNVPEHQLTRLEENQYRIFLPLVESTKNYDEFDIYKAIRANLDYLDAIDRRVETPSREPMNCLLCGRGHTYLLYHQIVSHIYSPAHIKRLEEFEVEEERARRRLVPEE